MIAASSQCFDYTFHLKGKEKGGESGDRKIGFDGKKINLLVILLLKCSHNKLFFIAKFGEKLAFYAFVSGAIEHIILPSHGIDKVESRRDEHGFIVTNEVITLVKDTSLAFSISVMEMFTTAKAISSSQSSMLPLIMAGILYYIFNFIVAFLMERFEKKLDYYS